MSFKKYLKDNADYDLELGIQLSQYQQCLKEVIGLINMRDITTFLNEMEYDYEGMNDLEMILAYIKFNQTKDSPGV